MAELERKTLKGSGGHIVADLSAQEIKKARLAGADLFIGALGRVGKERIAGHYCKNCSKDYDGAPEIKYEKMDEEVAEGYTLSEQGEYLCRKCGSLIAHYKTFAEAGGSSSQAPEREQGHHGGATDEEGFVAIRKLLGMSVYDANARLVGTVKEIGLTYRKSMVVVISTTEHTEKQVPWEEVSGIGDIVLLRASQSNGEGPGEGGQAAPKKCGKCGNENEADSQFCEQCGQRLA